MQLQAQDFSFIPKAAAMIGTGIEKGLALKRLNLDRNKVVQARDQRIQEAVVEYQEATGENGSEGNRKAYAFVSRYYPQIGETEDPHAAIERMDKADEKFYKNLASEKKKRYTRETQPQTVSVETDKVGKVQPGTPQTAGPAGKPSRMPGSLSELQDEILYSPQQTKEVTIPAPGANERYDLARKYGVLGDAEVQYDVERESARELGQEQFPDNATRDVVAQSAAQYPAYPKQSQDIVGSFPTKQQVSQEQRLSKNAEDRIKMQGEMLKAKKWQISLQNRKANSDEALEINKALAQASTKKLELELKAKAIEAQLTTANKQGFDRELDQNKLQELFDGLSEIKESIGNATEAENIYRDLLKSENQKHGKGISPTNIQSTTPSRSGFDAWKNKR